MTEYNTIFDSFKDKITDYDLPLYDEAIQIEMLCSLLNKACSKFRRICKSDLSKKDDELLEFVDNLSIEEIDILTEWMVFYWITPHLNNTENLRNQLSTKDFSFFSPANLLSVLQKVHSESRRRARSITNEYSYIHSDLENLKA